MPENVFRIVVAAATAVAAIAFVAQAAILAAVYRAVRKMQQTAEPLAERAGPIIDQLGPMIESIQEVAQKAASTFEKAGPTIEKIGPVIEKTELVIERGAVVLDAAHRILDGSRPHIAEISGEVATVTRMGREQVERLGELLRDAGDRARARLEQIDRFVDSTVEQVEQAGDAMKRTLLRPVREVNGIAAGISAAYSTLVRGRKSSVESTTQDEEMFI
jgi:ABC-type transporter Mla subunit MlaD